jgi:PAS domain S-box-containing protein
MKAQWQGLGCAALQSIPHYEMRELMSAVGIPSNFSLAPFAHVQEHSVQLYVDDCRLVNVISKYIGRALATGERGVVVATANHRDALSQQLCTQGFDLESLTREGLYMTFDAADTLNLFMANGHIDDQLFYTGAQTLLEQINQPSKRVPTRTYVFGEAVALLWAAGKPEDAIRFETLWNRVVNGQPVSTLCAYPIMGFYSESDIEMFLRVCSEHWEVSLSEESYSDIARLSRTGHQRFQEDLIAHEAELRFKQLIEAVKERCVFMMDRDGKISTWNPGSESMHGYAANEVVGRHASFLDNKEDDKFASKLATAVQKGLFEDECWRTRKDGSRFFATIAISPARNQAGDLMGFAETVRLSRNIH